MSEKIVKKNLGPRMTHGISYVTKLSHHMSQCKVAEDYLKNKLNEDDFSLMRVISGQAEELWRMFQEEYEVKNNG